jgi:hypothetical protein
MKKDLLNLGKFVDVNRSWDVAYCNYYTASFDTELSQMHLHFGNAQKISKMFSNYKPENSIQTKTYLFLIAASWFGS